MSIRQRFMRGAMTLGAGQAAGQGLSFARNIIVARLIGPEDFGIAATFAITVSMLEMLSDFAADRLVVQDRDGHEDGFLATVHTWQLGRGIVMSGALFALAWPLALLFRVPEAYWSFNWLALTPLARGLIHLDIRRQQRSMHFWPWVGTELGSQALATLAALPLAWWLCDYSVMLWVLLIRAWSQALLSHVFATNRYRWAWQRDVVRRLFAFGLPLLANGLLLFAIMQGDRVLVGARYSMEALGYYSAAFVLAGAPAMLLGSTANSLFLPALSSAQDDAPVFSRRYALCAEVFALAAAASGTVLILLSGLLLQQIYGEAYMPAAAILTWLAIAQTVRMLRVAPLLGAMARGDTISTFLTNVYRLIGFLLALVAALWHAPITYVAASAAIGEVAALMYAVARITRRHEQPLLISVRVAVVLAAVLALSAAVAVPLVQVQNLFAQIGLTLGCLLVVVTVTIGILPSVRSEARRVLAQGIGALRGVAIAP